MRVLASRYPQGAVPAAFCSHGARFTVVQVAQKRILVSKSPGSGECRFKPNSPRDREGDEPVREISVGNRLRVPMELVSAWSQCRGGGGQDIWLTVQG